jgi:transposase-like protein
MEEAAMMVADGTVTVKEIAEHVGRSARQLAEWKTWPEFQAAVERYRDQIRAEVLKEGLTRKEVRIMLLSQQFYSLEAIMLERGEKFAELEAKHPRCHFPGANRGLVIVTLKEIAGMIIPVEKLDVRLCREMRAVLAQIAREVGDRG